jgi:hypothetical protein
MKFIKYEETWKGKHVLQIKFSVRNRKLGNTEGEVRHTWAPSLEKTQSVFRKL